jgi:hypothetical protein
MPATATVKAKEQSTLVLTVYYWDENGTAVTPNAVTWTLMDESGTTINSRSAVSISSPSTSNDITLSGDDLAFQTGESGEAARYLRIDATYDSGSETDLPLKDHVLFYIMEVKGVS